MRCEGPDLEMALALFVEGDLPLDEVAALEGHLETCDRCRAFLRDLRASQQSLKALSSEPIPEGALASVRVRVLADTGREPAGGPRVPAWTWAAIAAGMAILALVLGALSGKPARRREPLADVTRSEPAPARRLLAPNPEPRPSPPSPEATPPDGTASPWSPTTASPGVPDAQPSDPLKAATGPSIPGAATESPPASMRRRPRSADGSEGRAAGDGGSALTPEEADQLARAVVAMARIEGRRDPRDHGVEGQREAPEGSPTSRGTLVRWTTADPNVVIYWQLDSDGGES